MLHLSTHTVGDAAIVDCKGKIVYGDEIAIFRTFVRDLSNQHHWIVLDLSGVTHLDSNGIGTIVSLWASLRSIGGDLRLAALSSRVHDVLTISKLTTLLGVFDSPEQAAASFVPTCSMP
jgi:anti-sigma B factor antagonist